MRYLSAGTGPDTTRISRIGLGAWQFGSPEWGYGKEYAGQEAHAIVRRALELGVTLFDTAEIYGFGRSERILGAAIGEDRDSVFLATKLFPLLPVAPVVEQRAVASANRLGTRRLDLYQVHQPNPVVRDGTIMRGMRALQRVGLVGEVGVSNYSLDRWRAAEQALGSRVLSNQVRYSLVDRSPEQYLLPFAEMTGHLVIAYSPLAQGLLSGKYDRDHRPANRIRASSPMFLPENLDRAGDLIATLREVADAHAATPAQIALAWVIRHPAVAAIPGASSVGQLESNVAAADIDLTDDEYQALHAAAVRFRPVTGPAVLPHLLRSRIARLGWPGDRYRRRRRAHPDQLRHHHRGRGEPRRVQGSAIGARSHAAARLADHPGQPVRRRDPRRAGLPDAGRRPRAGRPGRRVPPVRTDAGHRPAGGRGRSHRPVAAAGHCLGRGARHRRGRRAALRGRPLPGHRAAPPQPGRPRPRPVHAAGVSFR
jgi:aryl-alcohol dehydrogenase-like predicted oxidoreductase